MIDDALVAHFRTLLTVAGADMRYQRLDQTFFARMVLARRRQDVEEMQQSAALSAKIVDVLIRPVDFKLDEPRRGDQIVMKTGRVFETRSQPNLPCWEWSDPRHTFMRIHTIEQLAQSVEFLGSAKLVNDKIEFTSTVPSTTVKTVWTLDFSDPGFPNHGRKIVIEANGARVLSVTSDVGGSPIARLTTNQLTGDGSAFIIVPGQQNDIVLTSGGEIVITMTTTDSSGQTQSITL